MKNRILINLLLLGTILMAQTNYDDINKEIEKGSFTNAQIMIEELLNNKNLSADEIDSLKFEIERQSRIKKDFTLTEVDVLEYWNQAIWGLGLQNSD